MVSIIIIITKVTHTMTTNSTKVFITQKQLNDCISYFRKLMRILWVLLYTKLQSNSSSSNGHNARSSIMGELSTS